MVDQPVHQNKKTGLGWLSHVVPNSAPSKLDSSRPEMLAPYMFVKIIEQIWHICNTRAKRKHLMYEFWHKVCKTYKYIQYVASICYFQSFCKLPLHPKQSHALSCSPCGTCGKDDLSAMLIAQCSSSFPRVALATLEPRFSSWNFPGNFQQIHGICIASIIESVVINFNPMFFWKSLSCPPITLYSHV